MAAAAEPLNMRAVRFHDYGPPSALVLEDVARPEPKEGEVLVRVRGAGVNAIDWKFRAGHLKEFMPLEMPYTPGYDVAGTVEKLGPGVSDFVPGDDVFGLGSATYADFAIVPAAVLARKPANISFDEAATLALAGGTAWGGIVEVAQLASGQTLLIQGASGGVGSLAVQLGRWRNAHVIATTSTGNVEYVRSLGADDVIDYTKTKFEDVVNDVDVVFDTVGGDVTERSWEVLKPGGILIAVAGMPDLEKAAEHGVRTSGVPVSQFKRSVLEELATLIESGALSPQVRHVFALADVAAAHAAAEEGHGRGRIVLRVSQ